MIRKRDDPSDDHPSKETFQRMLTGRLAPAGVDSLLRHVEECASCLEQIESIWADVSPAAMNSAPRLNEAQARQLENRLLLEIRRVTLADRMVTLGSRDFLMLVLELVKPLASLLSSLQTSDPLTGRKP